MLLRGLCAFKSVCGMFWLDTTNHILKMRNEANSAWISLYDMANSHAVDAKASGISITAGTGLTDGGALSASRSIAIADGGVGATQIADGCILLAKLAPYSAGDYVIITSYQVRSTSSTSYVKLKEIQLDYLQGHCGYTSSCWASNLPCILPQRLGCGDRA